MYERILVPLDGSAMAEASLTRARPLLARKGAELVLLRVVDIVPTLTPGHPTADLSSVSILDSIQEEAEKYLDGWIARLEKEGLAARRVVRVGTSAETILDVAEAEKVSLLAMTTHGRSGFSRWIFGSVTEKVLRHAPCPVLVLHSFGPSGEAAPGDELRVGKILVPVDGSERSHRIEPHAIELARTFGASVEVIHVVESLVGESPFPQAEREVEVVRDRIAAAGIQVSISHRGGYPAAEIVDRAEEGGFDLIAMSSHGRSGLGRWLMGSVAEKVIRATKLPIFLMR